MKNIAIFASGSGSNAENIIRYLNTAHGDDLRVSVVVCNRPEARVIERARNLGVPVEVLTKAEINDPERMMEVLDSHAVDGIVLAGFLLMIPPFLIGRYEGRIINIHPSLLPKYGGKGMYGIHIHRAVVENREKETGITVHLVTDRCDEGQIIFQTNVAVAPEDTPEDVERKIHALEKEHFPQVVKEHFTAPT